MLGEGTTLVRSFCIELLMGMAIVVATLGRHGSNVWKY
jgi:hypothetical protein